MFFAASIYFICYCKDDVGYMHLGVQHSYYKGR